MDRRTLEKNVAAAGISLPYSEDDMGWIEGEEFDAFIQSLIELAGYYDDNWDESITYVSVEVLSVYFLAVHVLTSVLLSPRQIIFHQRASEKLRTLQSIMEDITGLGYAYLNEHPDE